MAARRLNPDTRIPGYQTRISIRASPPKEPRDECVNLPKPVFNRRPTPLDIELAQTKAPSRPPPPTPPVLQLESESVRDPEIVDLAAPKSWHRPEAPSPVPLRRSMSGNRGCPSRASRRSEMSFGILDYYIRDVTPVQSPDLPTVSTPVLDPAVDRFDFGLVPAKEKRHTMVQKADTNAGAETEVELIHLSPPSVLISNCRPQHKKTYSLFPSVKEATSNPASHRLAQVINDSPLSPNDVPEVPTIQDSPTPAVHQRHPTQILATLESTPARRRAQTTNTPSPTESAYLTRLTSLPSPHASYRPRKESLSSVRSRKDSVQSRLIPLRILSSSTAASRSSASTSTATSSPATHSRWSDDTITSPTAATTPGPRTSFGSLLMFGGEDGGAQSQYPACFFEDDDEEAPLRRKYRWQNSWQKHASVTTQERKGRSGRGRFDERKGFWETVGGWVLCGDCRGVVDG